MSSSDEEVNVKKVSKKGTKSDKPKSDYQIKPAKGGESLDTSNWPLLLKVTHSPILTHTLSPLELRQTKREDPSFHAFALRMVSN